MGWLELGLLIGVGLWLVVVAIILLNVYLVLTRK